VCATTVTTAIPVVNAKARANAKAIFFMTVIPCWCLPEPTRAIRDRHHVLELFGDRKLLRQMSEDCRASHTNDQDF
jgi:hypothetical protein